MQASACPTELPGPVEVLGFPIRPLRIEGLIESLVCRAKARIRTTACYVNAHTVNLAFRDDRFREVLSGSELLYADGASVVWASRLGGRRLPERMTAADYFPRFAQRCDAEGVSLFLLAGKPGVAEQAADKLRVVSPSLRITGTHHGYFKPEESAEVVEKINAADPDVLAIGLSSPRQEYWLAEWGDQFRVPVRWCVGALFDYIAGLEARAPAWMCRIGCEWLYRLGVDPLGKWRRYLLGNPMFVWNTIRWNLRQASRRPKRGSARSMER